MNMSAKRWILLALVLLGIGVGLWAALARQGPDDDESGETVTTTEEIGPVSFENPQRSSELPSVGGDQSAPFAENLRSSAGAPAVTLQIVDSKAAPIPGALCVWSALPALDASGMSTWTPTAWQAIVSTQLHAT